MTSVACYVCRRLLPAGGRDLCRGCRAVAATLDEVGRELSRHFTGVVLIGTDSEAARAQRLLATLEGRRPEAPR